MIVVCMHDKKHKLLKKKKWVKCMLEQIYYSLNSLKFDL